MGKRIARFTYKGETLLSLKKSSSGFVTSFVNPSDSSSRKVHLTSLQNPLGYSSHITDERGGTKRHLHVSRSDEEKLKRLVKPLLSGIQRYRKNSVAWSIPGLNSIIEAVAVAKDSPPKEIELERLEAMMTPSDALDRKRWKKVRISELARSGHMGFRIEHRRLYVVWALESGYMLKLPWKRLEKLSEEMPNAFGLGFRQLVDYVEKGALRPK